MKKYLSALLGLLCAFGCETKSEQSAPDPESLRSSLKPTTVHVVMAEIKPFDYLVYTLGKVQAAQSVEVKFKTGGQLEDLTVKNGQIVAKGYLLARLDDDQEQLDLKKAAASLTQKQFEYKSEMMSFEMSEKDNDKIKLIEKNIRHSSGLVQAELNHEEAQLHLAYTKLRAPIAGVITNLAVSSGNHVAAGDKLCDIYNPNQLEVLTHVLEGDLDEIKVGNKAIITPIDHNLSSEGVVSEINPQVDDEGLIQLTLKLNSKNNGLLPGMNTNVVIKVPKERNIVIPKEAIVIRSGKEVVFVAEDGKAKWHYVTTGLDNGEEVEILKGLDSGDSVIISNNLQLAHDAMVVTK